MLRRFALLTALVTATGCGGNFNRDAGARREDGGDLREANASTNALQAESPPATTPSTSGAYFDLDRDGVRFGNFSDLIYIGYCAGISTLHAYKALPAERRSALLGNELNSLFNIQNDTDHHQAVRVARTFTSLFQSTTMSEALKNLDPKRVVSFENIHGLYRALQNEPTKSEGLLAQLKGISDEQGTPTNFSHMVYIYKAELDGDVYRFTYVNPTFPQRSFVLNYDRKLFKKLSKTAIEFSQFSEDSTNHFSWHIYWPLDEFGAVMKKSLAAMKKDPVQRPIVDFLGFAANENNSLEIWKDASAKHMVDRINWLNNLDAKKLEMISPIRQQSMLTLANFREFQKLMSVAQHQIDSGCDRFRSFYNFIERRRPNIAQLFKAEMRDLVAVYSFQATDASTGSLPESIKKQSLCLSSLDWN